MRTELINNIPVQFGANLGPIMEVHFLDVADHPAPAPYDHRIAMYTNFNQAFVGESDVREFITRKLAEHAGTQKVAVLYHKP